MEDRLLDKIAEPFNLQLPEYESMEKMIASILPAVRSFSYTNLEADDVPLYRVDWVKMSDVPGDNKLILYRFEEGRGSIQVATDGEISSESYEIVNPKRIIVGDSVYRNSYLYNLAFLDEDFLILQRHGNQENLKRKYLFFCREAIGAKLSWSEALERLVDKYRNSQFPVAAVAIIVAIVIGLMLWFF